MEQNWFFDDGHFYLNGKYAFHISFTKKDGIKVEIELNRLQLDKLSGFYFSKGYMLGLESIR